MEKLRICTLIFVKQLQHQKQMVFMVRFMKRLIIYKMAMVPVIAGELETVQRFSEKIQFKRNPTDKMDTTTARFIQRQLLMRGKLFFRFLSVQYPEPTAHLVQE